MRSESSSTRLWGTVPGAQPRVKCFTYVSPVRVSHHYAHSTGRALRPREVNISRPGFTRLGGGGPRPGPRLSSLCCNTLPLPPRATRTVVANAHYTPGSGPNTSLDLHKAERQPGDTPWAIRNCLPLSLTLFHLKHRTDFSLPPTQPTPCSSGQGLLAGGSMGGALSQ